MAMRIAVVLRSHGVPVWYSETNLLETSWAPNSGTMKLARLSPVVIGL